MSLIYYINFKDLEQTSRVNNYFHLKEISSRNLLRISLLEILLPNPKKTEELTLKLIKGQPHYKSIDLLTS